MSEEQADTAFCLTVLWTAEIHHTVPEPESRDMQHPRAALNQFGWITKFSEPGLCPALLVCLGSDIYYLKA